MKKYVLGAVFLLTLAAGAGWMRMSSPVEESSSGSEPARPSPIQEHLPRLPVRMAEESVRTRVANTVQAAEKPQAEPGGTDWAVVMAIYKDYDAAQRRASNIAQGTAFKASVYPPDGGASKYMVVLESGLTYGKAKTVRDRAVSGGLPADTYVTRLLRARE
jgi:hypothetical protein